MNTNFIGCEHSFPWCTHECYFLSWEHSFPKLSLSSRMVAKRFRSPRISSASFAFRSRRTWKQWKGINYAWALLMILSSSAGFQSTKLFIAYSAWQWIRWHTAKSIIGSFHAKATNFKKVPSWPSHILVKTWQNIPQEV